VKRPPRKCLDCDIIVTKKKRRCDTCREAHSVTIALRRREAERKRRSNPAYRERQRLAAERYRRDNAERIIESKRRDGRRQYVKRTYGLTLDDIQREIVRQDRRCAICQRVADLHVDHDHVTGAFRALLCRKCNMGLGLFSDSPALLRDAADYLERRQPLAEAV
jgi:hypothetical protein